MSKRDLNRFTPEKITEIIYSVAISFCCYIDLTKQRDQKTPGTFLEYLISHLFAWQLRVNPTTRIQVLNLDMDTELPTDFIFNLGKDRPKFHLPIKAFDSRTRHPGLGTPACARRCFRNWQVPRNACDSRGDQD